MIVMMLPTPKKEKKKKKKKLLVEPLICQNSQKHAYYAIHLSHAVTLSNPSNSFLTTLFRDDYSFSSSPALDLEAMARP